MNVEGQVAVVTGAAAGIGAALCRALSRAGAAAVVATDIDEAGLEALARELGCGALRCDVSVEADVVAVIDNVERCFGPISLFCSNAGIAAGFDPTSQNVAAASNAIWERSWAVNVMAHIYAARALVPRMCARGGGYFLNTVSAAGLLSQIGSAVYATTKHAAIGFAEALAIAHRAQGIKVSVLCPQGVDTKMLHALPRGPQSNDGLLSADDVAAAALTGIEAERFLILPHPEVARYMRNKVNDYDRWLKGMTKLHREAREMTSAVEGTPPPSTPQVP
jgi:NAD(P)-dependent dehydrogenase (short-subunit alcohol dehydrogenase family)